VFENSVLRKIFG